MYGNMCLFSLQKSNLDSVSGLQGLKEKVAQYIHRCQSVYECTIGTCGNMG